MKEKDEISTEINKASITAIGLIISEHCDIEKLMQIYIAKFFCKSDAHIEVFIEYFISPHVFFDKTREVFTDILKLFKTKHYDKYKEQIDYIIEINRMRVLVAHYVLDRSEDALLAFKTDKSIRFHKFKKHQKPGIITIEDVETLLIKSEEIKAMIELLSDEL